MAKQYSPQNFFRKVPNQLLQQYFASRNVLSEIDFGKLTEAKIEPLYEAWINLPEDTRNEFEQDFREICELANEGGAKVIMDEAEHNGEKLGEQLSKLDNFYAKAFWTFLERKKYWDFAIRFNSSNHYSATNCYTLKNLPCKKIENTDTTKFAQEISNYFHTKQGRGKNCKIDYYYRNDLDYFFAYPEDYAQATIEWVNKEFKRRPHNPAFEIIFVYSTAKGTLNLMFKGGKKISTDLQEIFAKTILQETINPAEQDEHIYSLNPMLSPNFEFNYNADTGIENITFHKFKLKARSTNQKITLEAKPSKENRKTIYHLLEKTTANIPVALTQVGITVEFFQNPQYKKNTRTFTLAYPNSCSLKQDGRDLVIRQVLIDSKIETPK